jgi:tetratricopeptide (TPR) repeat protein
LKEFQKQNHNVVQFPKLKERLHEKAMVALKDKKYKEAFEYYSQLDEMYEDAETSSDIQVGLVICLLELGYLQEAKEKCKGLLHKDVGNYYDILQIYLTILVQLHEYDEVVVILEAVLHENRIPSDKAEHLFQLLDFSRKMQNQGIVTKNSAEEKVDSTEYAKDLLTTEDPNLQLQTIHKLRSVNIRKVVSVLKEALLTDGVHPAVKTMIIQLLQENQVDEQMFVEKFGNSIEVNPMKTADVFEQMISIRVIKTLDDELGQENPTLYDVCRQIWDHYLLMIYPFDPKPMNEKLWAAALHKCGYLLHGIDISMDEIIDRYEVDTTDVENAVMQLRNMEEQFFIH